MGWRGTVRAMGAAARRAERESERRQKRYANQQMIVDAEEAVSEWQQQIREIVSLHVNQSSDVDWRAVSRQPEPSEPLRKDHREQMARAKLGAFKPRFWHVALGGSRKAQQKLEAEVDLGRSQDDREHQQALAEFRSRHSEWSTDVDLARRLLAGDVTAERDIIEEMQSFSSEGLMGTRLSFHFSEEAVHVIAHIHGDDVVPKIRRKQLQSGRLSESKMPVGEANELYQDYVCSVALKVAGDLFALLLRDDVYVTCATSLLDSATGRLEEKPILSVRFVRETFRSLGLKDIDPSDSMQNFVHEMKFKRSSGFGPVAALRFDVS